MHILVCYKIVPEEQDIIVNQDKTLSFERAEMKLSQYDLNAVEAGVKLAEELNGEVFSLTVGTGEAANSKLQKSILSRGPHGNYMLCDTSLAGADCCTTARALAAAVGQTGDWDLIICGEGSGDMYSQQVGVQLGELLGATTLNGVSAIMPDGDKLIVERSLENEVETLSVAMPAVLSVTTDINITRIPTMRDILSAGKKPSTVWNTNDVPLPAQRLVETEHILAPEQTGRQCQLIVGDDGDSITAFLCLIRPELG